MTLFTDRGLELIHEIVESAWTNARDDNEHDRMVWLDRILEEIEKPAPQLTTEHLDYVIEQLQDLEGTLDESAGDSDAAIATLQSLKA